MRRERSVMNRERSTMSSPRRRSQYAQSINSSTLWCGPWNVNFEKRVVDVSFKQGFVVNRNQLNSWIRNDRSRIETRFAARSDDFFRADKACGAIAQSDVE